MLFLETVLDDIGQNRFAIIQGTMKKDPHDNQSIIYFTEISHQAHWFSHWFPGTYVVRKKTVFLRSIGGGQSIDLWVQSGDSTVTKEDQRRNQKISRSQWINQIFLRASGAWASISVHIMAGTRVGTAYSLPWNTDFYIYIY